MVSGWCKHNCGLDGELLSLYLGSNTSLLIKIGIITINTFLPMRNKFVYSYGIKICAPGFNERLESTFCYLWKHFPCKNLSRCLKNGSQLARGQVRQNFIAQFIQLLSVD